MNYKILIIAGKELSKSLFRAMLHLDCLRKTLERRFILKEIDMKTIELSNIKNASAKLYEGLSLLIIELYCDEALSLIWDIRFQNLYECEQGIPILGVSYINNDTNSKISRIKFHLQDYGVLLNPPFTLDDINNALNRAEYLDENKIEGVKVSVTNSGLIRQFQHDVTPQNYLQFIKKLKTIVPADIKKEIIDSEGTIKTYKDAINFFTELEDKVNNCEKEYYANSTG